jgi:hypothetical protein
MKRLLHVIADYEPMSQEFGEILQRIWSQNWDIDLAILPTSVPSMDTIGDRLPHLSARPRSQPAGNGLLRQYRSPEGAARCDDQ